MSMPVHLPLRHEGSCDLGELEASSNEFISQVPDIATDAYGNTELDSHANMCCLGRQALVFHSSDLTCDVTPYDPAIGTRPGIPLCDMALAYDEPNTGETYILVFLNSLYIKDMEHNLVPPFIMREAGIKVHDTPLIHCDSPSSSDHSIYMPDAQLRIQLHLNGIFSCFKTRKPSEQEFIECEKIMCTPASWNPHSNSWAANEASILDWEGNIMDPSRDSSYARALLEKDELSSNDEDDGDRVVAHASWSIDEGDSLSLSETPHQPRWFGMPRGDNEVSAVLSSVSNALDEQQFASALTDINDVMEFGMSMNNVAGHSSQYLFDMSLDNDMKVDISAAQALPPKGITAHDLAQHWQIDIAQAKETLKVTTQRVKRSKDPGLSRHYSSNDRMLRYRRIKRNFFMDTMFATSKGGRSIRGNTCAQIFVSDSTYVHFIPMKKESDVKNAMKAFAKEVGAPDTIICDHSKAQTGKEVRSFCAEMSTTLRVLEKGTPWANKAELYVGLFKRAVREDMRKSDCPMVLWDYCCERRAMIHNATASNNYLLNGQTPYFDIHGVEPDISNTCQYNWYDWVYFRDHGVSDFPYQKSNWDGYWDQPSIAVMRWRCGSSSQMVKLSRGEQFGP